MPLRHTTTQTNDHTHTNEVLTTPIHALSRAPHTPLLAWTTHATPKGLPWPKPKAKHVSISLTLIEGQGTGPDDHRISSLIRVRNYWLSWFLRHPKIVMESQNLALNFPLETLAGKMVGTRPGACYFTF